MSENIETDSQKILYFHLILPKSRIIHCHLKKKGL